MKCCGKTAWITQASLGARVSGSPLSPLVGQDNDYIVSLDLVCRRILLEVATFRPGHLGLRSSRAGGRSGTPHRRNAQGCVIALRYKSTAIPAASGGRAASIEAAGNSTVTFFSHTDSTSSQGKCKHSSSR